MCTPDLFRRTVRAVGSEVGKFLFTNGFHASVRELRFGDTRFVIQVGHDHSDARRYVVTIRRVVPLIGVGTQGLDFRLFICRACIFVLTTGCS